MKITLKRACDIIESNVPDWDSRVLENAAQFCLEGGEAWEFEGRPHDFSEFSAFEDAYAEIRAEGRAQ